MTFKTKMYDNISTLIFITWYIETKANGFVLDGLYVDNGHME